MTVARILVAGLLVLPAFLLPAAPAVPGATPQAVAPPGEPFVDEDALNAVLLEDADLFAAPSSDGEIVAHLPAGTVLGYAGETTDLFGRNWFTLRDPNRSRPRQQTWLAPFGLRELFALGGRAAVLADRTPVVAGRGGRGATAVAPAAGAATGKPDETPPPWWAAAGALTFGHAPSFGGVVAISARVVEERDAQEAIELLGGREGLADWPADPLPGELFVPRLLPLLFEFDGTSWQLARPHRLLAPSLNLLGNPLLLVDEAAPPQAGGPAVSCWELVGALTPRGEAAGSVQRAPAPALPRGRRVPLPQAGEQDPVNAPPRIQQMIPPAPPAALIPPRVDPPATVTGVELRDSNGRQAVYLEQTLDPEMVKRLRGRDLALDVVARAPAGAAGATTFGIDIEAHGEAGGVVHFPNAFTVDTSPLLLHWAFTLPEDAEAAIVRLLPLDRGLAVEQRGVVIFERVALRLARWPARPPAATVLLNRVTGTSWEGVPLHTRAAIAVTSRSADEVAAVWPGVAASSWSEADKQLVLAGELRHGMSPEQVRLSWGEPREEAAGGVGIERRWLYDDRSVTFADGKVIAFKIESDDAAATAPLRCSGNAGGGGPGA